jgi:hypothetical protein
VRRRRRSVQTAVWADFEVCRLLSIGFLPIPDRKWDCSEWQEWGKRERERERGRERESF